LTPALAAPKAPLFFVLKNAEPFYRGLIPDFTQVGIAAADARTLVLTLEHPAPHLLALLASGSWLPVQEATVEKFGNTRDSAWTRPGNFVGNGPFVLAEWQHNQRIVVKKNPRYHNVRHVLVDALSFEAFDNGDSEERAFRAGQVDVTMAVPASKLATYASPPLQVQPLAETRYLSLNLQRPPLNDARVRRALSLAIDRQAVVDAVLKGGQRRAFNFIPPGLGGYFPVESPAAAPGAAAEEARRLLAEAGFPAGRDFPKLEFSTWTNAPVLEAIQQMWHRELGIDVAIVQREAKVHQAALRSGDYAIGLMPAIPDYDDPAALFGELVTDAANNYPHWSNARYDALVAQAGRTPDATRRLTLYRDAESVLLAELPVVPLYFNAQNYLVAPRVRGWREDGLWTRYYLDLSLTE
jgi:oligopeptide transport system substrate-binding protein